MSIFYILLLTTVLSWKTQASIPQTPFKTFARQCRAQSINIEDEQTISLRGFNYDGLAPAGHFIVGNSTLVVNERANLRPLTVLVPTTWRCEKLGFYEKENLVLKFPKGRRVQEYKWLSVSCLRYNHNFCYLLLNSTGVAKPSKESDVIACDNASRMRYSQMLLLLLFLFPCNAVAPSDNSCMLPRINFIW